MATDLYWGYIFADINLAVLSALLRHLYHSNQTSKIPESLNTFAVPGTVMRSTLICRQTNTKMFVIIGCYLYSNL